MALFKKLTKKVVSDVKETVKEESQKTVEDLKNDICEGVKEHLPEIICAAAIVVAALILRKPVPVAVKVVVKQA